MKKLELIFRSRLESLKRRIPKLLTDEFVKDRIVLIGLFSSLLFLALIWVYSLFSFKYSDYLVPLRYNSFIGVTEVGNWYQIYQIPLFFSFCSVLNALLADGVYKKDRMVSYILLSINLFLGLTTFVIIINFARLTNI